MKRLSTPFAVVLTAALVVPAVVVSSPRPASASTTNEVLVTNQYVDASCPLNNRVLVADTVTGTKTDDLGKPTNVTGILVEAKPIERNTKVVALWHGTTPGHPLGATTGGVGVFDRATRTWTGFALPASVGVGADGNGASHSVASLPGGYFAVAHNGPYNGGSQWGYVLVFGPNGGTPVDVEVLDLAHGVEWDTRTRHVYAVGNTQLKKYELTADHKLNLLNSYPLPTSGGHDLRRRRQDDNYFVTTNSHVYTFFPATGTFSAPLTKTNGSVIGGGVKSIDQRFGDYLTEYSYHKVNDFRFTNGTVVPATGFCMLSYKHGRWIWPQGQPVYADEEGTAPPPPPPPAPSTARPVVWERDVLNANTAPVSTGSPTLWVGGTAWNNPTNVKTEIDKRADAGKIPYVIFYNWGDNANPGITDFASVSQAAIDRWKTFATRIAEGIGSRKAYVIVEPEWDVDVPQACTAKYKNALTEVLNIFKRISPKAILVNGVGLWAEGYVESYNCFDSAASQFHMQGFLMHVVSNNSSCTARTDNYNGPYTDGQSLAKAEAIATRVRNKAVALKRLYGGNETLLYDLAVTSCGWGAAKQADLFDRLGDQLPTLYNEVGLRGALMRNGPPSVECGECFMGIGNESGFKYSTNTAAVARIDEAQTRIQNHLDTIANGAGPTFNARSTAPATAAPNEQVLIQSTVTNTGGSLSDATVRINVTNSAGGSVGLREFTGQTFANGASHDYDYTWTAAATPGTYTVKTGVYGPGGTPQYHLESPGFTITVGGTRPAFTSSASASPAVVTAGGGTTLTVTVDNTGGALTGGVVDVEFYDASGGRVPGQTWFEDEDIAAGASKSYTVAWTAPRTTGTYTVKVGVFGPAWNPQYHWNDSAGSVTVTTGTTSYSITGTTNRPAVQPNGVATLVVTVTNTGTTPLADGIVDLEMYDGANTRVAQQVNSGQNIAPGASVDYTWSWTAPAETGSYRLKAGVFTSSWQVVRWNDNVLTVGVTPFKLVTAAAASPAKVTPGGVTTITATVTNEGGALEDVIVDVEVYDSANQRVGQRFWTAQDLVAGSPSSYSWSWTAPAAAGTYTVRIGVMGASWTPTHHWNADADTITATNPAFTSTATVSASTVAPGSPVTISASFTNTGGSLVDGIVDLEIDDPSGNRVHQHFWSGQTINSGASAPYSHTWTAPASPTGTYTVRLGVFSSGWAIEHHWKNSAATISVGSTFQPSFTIGDGANTWWIEVYTSNDVTAVDVIGRDGQFYQSLPKKSWGAWAAVPPSELLSGQTVQLVARRSSDGATAASSSFGWLTQTPVTEPGWSCAITVGSGASTTWVEANACAAASPVHVKVGSGAWTLLTYSSQSGKWGKAINVPAGSKVLFRASRTADTAKAYSAVVTWLQ